MPSVRFKKILIANRGEIAVRVICACKELGIQTVAVYSEADRYSSHVRFADQAICIGPAKSARSYLDIPSIISAAEITDVDAIHPGYGFLSENAAFAEVCEASQIKFIGPRPEVIRMMGVKERARAFMRELGVPILPGSPGVLTTPEEGLELAAQVGYPVILKASAGGGGRGMRIVNGPDELPSLFLQAQNEAGSAFSSPDVYLEKYIGAPRHIEFQILADEHGNVEILGERECSIQRRHQKLLEESPSPAVTDAQRDEISAVLRNAIARAGYTNAGTVEFLMDEDGKLYFIEVNARVQVEHPVTEFVTGIDIVKSQIRIAQGETLAEILPGPVEMRGHAIECRINAENPETFVPSPGRITGFHLPGGIGVRVDTWAYTDCVIPPFYDSLVAKLITYGSDRGEAIRRMQRALSMFIVEGIYTSIPMQQRILADPDFQAGRFDTNFIKRFMPAPQMKRAPLAAALLCSALGLSWQLLTVHFNYGGNLTALFCHGSQYPVPPGLAFEHIYVFPDSGGYDGQSYHYMAHDPFDRSDIGRAVPDPSRRYPRILLPGIAHLLALGRPEWVDVSFLLSNLLFLGMALIGWRNCWHAPVCIRCSQRRMSRSLWRSLHWTACWWTSH